MEGSDATTFHEDPVYTPELFKYLQGGSSKPVLILGDGFSNPAPTGVSEAFAGSLSGLTLSDYSAIYVKSTNGCCAADNTLLNGFGSSVNAFIAAGGNVSIENYIGGGYDGVVVGGAAAPGGVIEGYGALNGGVGSGPTCTDGEVVTPLGISKGFGQPPVDSCWSHQGYDNTYWGALGYVDLIHADPAFTFRSEGHNGSSFLVLGGTLGSPGVPEPATWAMMLLGFFGLGSAIRSSRRRTATA